MNSVIHKYINHIRNNILYSPTKKHMYKYDDSQTIWIEIDKYDLFYYIKTITNQLIWTKEEEKIIKKISDRTYLSKIGKKCLQQIIKNKNDDETISQFNRKKGVLPISNNNVIELQTLHVRPRIYSDYFTSSCNVTYIPDYDRETIYRFFASLFCESYDVTRPPNNNEIDGIYYSMKLLGYMITGENEINSKEFMENENNEHQLVSEQREKRKSILEKYKVLVYNDEMDQLCSLLSFSFYEVANCNTNYNTNTVLLDFIKNNNCRILSIPNTVNIDKLPHIQGCVPMIKHDNPFSTSYKKIPLMLYRKKHKINYYRLMDDFFSACCEGAFMYYQDQQIHEK
jgi:hypothetical protein